jgi:hypothetical protein
MKDLSTWAAAYREARQPSEALRERILAAVEDQPSRWRGRAIGVGVGALLGAAALLLLSWAVRWMRPELEPTEAQSQAPYERSQEGEATTRVQPKAPAPKTPAVVREPIEPPAIEAPARPRPVRPSRAETDPAPAPSVDLESLRRLRAAEQLLPTDPARARTLIEDHVRDYPKSSLALEREALWIRAACRTGGSASLARRRASFVAREGVAAYLPAIEKDCAR